ncbi:MAG: HipA domain-containing protein, partial [Rhodospirillales bacterium]
MTDHLAIIVDGRIMGDLRKDKRARLTLAYDADWRQAQDAYPLSLSMPLVVVEHEHAKIEPWLWGLLPDNEAILARWGQRFQVSPRNPFALLAHVGEDCAGAIQIVQPERADALRTQPAGQVEWLDDKDIAERIRLLRKDQAAWRIARDAGQFSLAGAQPKTAFLFENGRWGVPSGRAPTTHIVKPPIEAFDGHAENEHVCLALARALGLPAAASQVRVFEGEVAIVVERYDRVRMEDSIRRLHQEDMCQALGLPPTGKYENEGGPGVPPIVELLRTYSSRPIDDVWTFIQALALNWLISGT